MLKKIDFQKLLQFIGEIYLFIILMIFPFMIDKTGFFHILECKYKFYVTITLIYILLIFGIVIICFCLKKYKDVQISKINWFAIVLLLINVLSYLFSPFLGKKGLFIGIGRYEGLLVNIIYILSFICISMFNKLEKRHLLYIMIMSILMSTIILLQYFGLNPLEIYKYGKGSFDYVGTIGNVDTVSALYTILISVSMCYYLFNKDNKYENILTFVSTLLSFIVILIIGVDSGKLALLCLILILIPWIINNNEYLLKFLKVIFLIVFIVMIQYLKHNMLFIILILSALILLILAQYILTKKQYNYINKKRIIFSYIIILVIILISLVIIYFIKFKPPLLYQMHELMHGIYQDEFGSYRIFLWKRTLKIIPEHLLIGTGPDTFSLSFMSKFSNDVSLIGPFTINDTAANIYLTMIVNIGVIGLIAYLGMILCAILKSLKNANVYYKILIIVIIIYSIQAFFNLSVVIITPIFYVLLGLLDSKKV